ncbi:MAG: DUF1631 domain-containing protein [Burkholderiales bacterium]|nr:DUF1631 domain-containing protein [Burkholderiales bacterium]
MSADKPERIMQSSGAAGLRHGGVSANKAMTLQTETLNTLSSCRDLAADLLSKSLSTMLDKIEESLFELAEKALDRDSSNLYLQARGEAQSKRTDIENEFRRRFIEGFERAVKGGDEADASFRKVDFDNLELSLVGQEDYEEDLAVTNIASRLRNKLGDDLNALNQRIGHLMAIPDGKDENNPMSPQAIVSAFRSACQKIESDLNVRLLVLKQFEQVAAENVPNVYQNINRFLVERNILPILPKGNVRRHARGAASQRRTPTPQVAEGGGDGVPPMSEADMAQYAAAYAAMAGQGGMPSAADLAAMGFGNQAGMGVPAGYGAQMGFGVGGFAPAAAAQSMPGMGAEVPAYVIGNEQELISTLQQLLALNQVVQAMPVSMSGMQAGVPGVSAPATDAPMMPASALVTSVGQSFLDALNRLQQGTIEGALSDVGNLDTGALLTGSTNVLHQIKTTSLATSLGHVDAMTIDIVAMLFDYIFDDDNIPGPMKALIGRLQIPVLKVAMLDSRFFARKQHPTRKLLDALAQAALGWSEEDGLDDRLYRKIAAIVESIVRDFDENIELFGAALEELEAFLAEEEQRAESSAEATATALIAAERAEVAKLHAEQTVTQRLAAATDVPDLIRDFLATQWTAVLAYTAQVADEGQEQWRDSVSAMDDLIWSIAPKVGVEERLRLVNMLPKLLKRLERGTEAAGVDRTAREAFFAELVHCHAQAIKAGLRAADATGVAPANPSAPAVAPVERQSIGAAAADPIVLGAPEPAPIAVPQAMVPPPTPEPVPVVDLLDLPALDMDPLVGAFEVTNTNWDHGLDKYQNYEDVVANQLKRGVWVDFAQADGSSMRAKLAWISPRKSRYLFTNRQGQNGLEFTLAELIGLFKRGEASMIESGPSVERAVSDMIGMLQPVAA